ncbi:MAG: hypothetical protein WD845_17415 [Pirellulales bacterium]
MKRSSCYLFTTLGLLVALSASPALAGSKGNFKLNSGGSNPSRSLNTNAMKMNQSQPKPTFSSNAARFTQVQKLQAGGNLTKKLGKSSQTKIGNVLTTPIQAAPRGNRLPNGINTSKLGNVLQSSGQLGKVGTVGSPILGKFKDRVILQENGKFADAIKDGVLKRGPILGAGGIGVLDPSNGPIFDPDRGPIFDPPGDVADPGNGNPPADPGNGDPPADPGDGNPPADPGNGDPPADPGQQPPDCPPHCPPINPPHCGGWGFPIPFPAWCGGYYGGYNGGYCATTTVVQPVYSQVTQAAAVEPVAQAIDLELIEVRQLDRGDLASDQGPAYRITLRNKSGDAVTVPFTVALAASIGRAPAADSAFAATRVNGLQAGQTLSVEVRLPGSAYKLGLNADGQPVPFTWLTAVADSHMEVEQVDRQNDFATMNRSEIVMVAQQ